MRALLVGSWLPDCFGSLCCCRAESAATRRGLAAAPESWLQRFHAKTRAMDPAARAAALEGEQELAASHAEVSRLPRVIRVVHALPEITAIQRILRTC